MTCWHWHHPKGVAFTPWSHCCITAHLPAGMVDPGEKDDMLAPLDKRMRHLEITGVLPAASCLLVLVACWLMPAGASCLLVLVACCLCLPTGACTLLVAVTACWPVAVMAGWCPCSSCLAALGCWCLRLAGWLAGWLDGWMAGWLPRQYNNGFASVACCMPPLQSNHLCCQLTPTCPPGCLPPSLAPSPFHPHPATSRPGVEAAPPPHSAAGPTLHAGCARRHVQADSGRRQHQGWVAWWLGG